MAAPAPSKKTLSDLKASLLRPSLTSQFQCWFNPPIAVRNWVQQKASAGIGNGYESEFISLSCSEASLPGSSLATHEINNDFTGVTERHVIEDNMMIELTLLFMLTMIIILFSSLRTGCLLL
jgi:hypothetical protein